MKLQAIKAVCAKAKRIVVMDTPEGKQWIGDGSGMYPVEGLRFTEGNICTVLDISTKQIGRMFIHADLKTDDPCVTVEPWAKDESLMLVGFPFYYEGCLVRLLRGQFGLLVINSAYLKPMGKEPEELWFYARQAKDGKPMVVVFADMLVGAIVMPYTMGTIEHIQAQMQEVCNMLPMTWEADKTVAIGYQTSIGGDAEDEEPEKKE